MMRKALTATLLLLVSCRLGAQAFIVTDKSCYIAGETVNCSAFCPKGASVLFVELFSSEGPALKGRIAVRDGRGGGSLRLPLTLPTGNYRLVSRPQGGETAGGPVISVINTFTAARVEGGVEIVGDEEYGSYGYVPADTGYGISAGEGLSIVNTCADSVKICVSLTRKDALRSPARHTVADLASLRMPSLAGDASRSGEVVKAVLAGPGSGQALSSGSVCALIAVPGSKTDCYSSPPAEDGTVEFRTENIYGEKDIVCMLTGLPEGCDCHLELCDPFEGMEAGAIPPLRLCRSLEGDLLRRSALLRSSASDRTAVSLPSPREHFFLRHEAVTYLLDDYTRFPTMPEVFVEITPELKLRRQGGVWQLFVIMEMSVSDEPPVWGAALAMIDGVPVPDQNLVATYDPSLVKAIEIYPHRYKLGAEEYEGVVNFVTFKRNMPGLALPDDVRIYSWQGAALPYAAGGGDTLWWHPLIELAPGESFTLPVDASGAGAPLLLSAEGCDSAGRAVYLKKSL